METRASEEEKTRQKTRIEKMGGREGWNAYHRALRLKNLEKRKAYNREWNKRWRQTKKSRNEVVSLKQWKVDHPEKVKAQHAVQSAIQQGKLKRLPCKICKDPVSVAHHPNYQKPLKVVFLCKSHHRQVHYGK